MAIALPTAVLPAGARRVAAEVTRSAFTSGLNEILVVSGVGALLAAAATALIRGRDFVAHAPAQGRPASGEPELIAAPADH